MVVLVTALALVAIGAELSMRLWPARQERAPGLFERLTIVAAIAWPLWLGTTWMLALAGMLTETALTVRAIVFLGAAAALTVPRLRSVRRGVLAPDKRPAVLVTIALLPLIFWVELILWRGAVLPPVTHDALSYHLPKAVLWARAEGFTYLRELDPRQRNIPANYEMLLTELVATQQSDTYTEWPSALFYVLFAIACAAIAERWVPAMTARAKVAVLLFSAAIPVLQLHSGAHKNDVMTAFFLAATMVTAGRWIARGETAALLLAITSTALAIGTKPQAAAMALFLAPFVLSRMFRALPPRRVAAVFIFGVAAFLLLGGAVYVMNMVHERGLAGNTAAQDVITYGDWKNLWQAPYVLLAAPFSRSAMSLYVPWEQAPWFWRRYEIYFSHLGIPFALCAAALPVVLLRKRERRLEPAAVSIAALAAFVVMLPVVFKPHGMYAISLPRYALFAVPVVFGWTLAPLAQRLPRTVLMIATLTFTAYAIDTFRNDAFAPPDFVQWAREHPGTRQIPFDSGRAATIADLRAGPDDTIALDAAYGSWIHPAFGAGLTRPIHFIPPGSGPPVIPADADWVVIDRTWSVIWDIAGFDDLSQVRQFIGRGRPRPEDLRVVRALARDPRFRLVYSRPGTNQAVYKRVVSDSRYNRSE